MITGTRLSKKEDKTKSESSQKTDKDKVPKQKATKKRKVELSLREEIEQELAKGPPREPPEV